MTKQGETTRRSFMAAVGVGAAALAVPAGAVAGRSGPASLAEAVAAWPGVNADLVARFRPVYLRELEQFAEELRPQLDAGGALHAAVSEEFNQDAIDRLEALAAERFGVKVERSTDKNGYWVEDGPEEVAVFISAVSPSIDEHGPAAEWAHPGYCARSCIASDVIAYAKRQGWGVRS